MLKGNGVFIIEGLANIRSVGTIVCTGTFAARAMAPKIHAQDPARVIVELGVGTGSITKEIIKHLRSQDTFIGIESNEKFLEICRENLCIGNRNISVRLEHGLAQNIRSILKKYRVLEADDIVCTIPFRVLPEQETRRILEEIKDIIKPGGHFTFIRFLPALKNKIIFDILDTFRIVRTKLIMRNIPPAEVITMEKMLV